MTAQPVITIVTPTKNRLRLLCETMDSVQAQDFVGWEHIIVDDGSDDGTAEEVGRRSAEDARVRFVRREGDPHGANACRNIGIRESHAELVMFLDSDDLLRRGCLRRRVALMARNLDLDFAVFRAGIFRCVVGDLGRLYHPMTPGDDLLRFLSHECVWEITSPVWRRAFLERMGGFDESLLSMQDMELHLRALAARGKYFFISEIDHDIRWLDDPNRTSARHFSDAAFIRANELVRNKLFEMLRDGGLMTWSRRRALLGLCFATCESWVRSGNLFEALKTWGRGCEALRAPRQLFLEGAALLAAKRWADKATERLLGKWKGWRRLRPEPVPDNLLV